MILFTGTSQITGLWILRHLIDMENEVRVLYSEGENISHLKSISGQLEFVKGSILDIIDMEEAMDGIDVVVHTDTLNAYTPASYEVRLKHNVEGTSNIVNAMLKKGVKELVFLSSLEALAMIPDKSTDEDTKAEKNEWTTEYGLSMLLAEREVWRGSVEGLNISIIHAAEILIPDKSGKHIYAQSLKNINKGKVRVFPTSIYYVDVANVANLIFNIYQNKLDNKRYFAIGGSEKVEDFYTQIADSIPVKIKTKKASAFSMYFKIFRDWVAHFLFGNPREFRKVNAKRNFSNFVINPNEIQKPVDINWTSLDGFLKQTLK